MDALIVAAGPIEATVLPGLGARLHRLRVGGQDLLRTPRDLAAYEREPFFWGAFVMAPWCNRIEPGLTLVAGREVALGANFGDGSAIHGAVYARPWQVAPDGSLHILAGDDGRWPWAYQVVQRLEVGPDALRLRLALTNRSSDPMPAGLGWHPWFRAPAEVAIHARAVYGSNLDSAADPSPVGGDLDRRRLGVMPPNLDGTWTELDDPAVQLAWPDLGMQATMRVGPTVEHVVAASPEGFDAVAVEPQTHAPQGLRRLVNGERGAMTMLAPGDDLDLEVVLTFSPMRPT